VEGAGGIVLAWLSEDFKHDWKAFPPRIQGNPLLSQFHFFVDEGIKTETSEANAEEMLSEYAIRNTNDRDRLLSAPSTGSLVPLSIKAESPLLAGLQSKCQELKTNTTALGRVSSQAKELLYKLKIAGKKDPLVLRKSAELETLVKSVGEHMDQCLLVQATIEAMDGTEEEAGEVLKEAEGLIGTGDSHLGASKEGLKRFAALLPSK
jgi:hypothetical protein